MALMEVIEHKDEVFQHKLVQVKKAIEELPPRCREIFTLSKQSGLSYEEVANRFDISAKTV